ncbi:hypothetical protein F2Q69_00036432 [Brassica cretica]|uniref:Uncharacterized protein n=1 Tax=Brassica cretica TaxID=69181 RepID=A0A8S9SET3_BRACR|nr:hypothetical protein F2Q69_00036432 [Brassica cretica]
MPVLLKSGQPASREEAVEKRNNIEPRNLHVSSILDHHVLNLICHARTAREMLTADLGD